MSVKIVIKPNTYFDSVSLMSISARANKLDGVEQAFVAMATEMNKGVLKNLGLLTPELEPKAAYLAYNTVAGHFREAVPEREFSGPGDSFRLYCLRRNWSRRKTVT